MTSVGFRWEQAQKRRRDKDRGIVRTVASRYVER
jgi:hypothetical protein